jgi:uncharacterized protein YyaL (SSP411 family)
MNRLAKEKAAYLRHSATQRIDWYPWSEEAFERAKLEDKPVFLSSGAIWCHWCHVMAKECFENDEIIELLNERCINIKLDRDERPDIDRIYQQAVAAMGSGGGWPLSVFLTPDKKPFFGGTYFPPEERYGRPGFKDVLSKVADFYRSHKDEIEEFGLKLMDFLKPKPVMPGAIDESFLEDGVAVILSEFDPQNGGFGTAPKFPMPGAIEFLADHYFVSRKESVGHVIKSTLRSMGKGGVHDQLGGGFHRYSTDGEWFIPHFEKMADDNAWLLKNYVDAYCLLGDDYFRDVALGIIRFVREVLSDPEGGFYASQDADVTPDDEGGYFTWTEEDFRKTLNEEEYRMLSLHLFHEKGSMHHDRSKRVLFVAREAEEIARETGSGLKAVKEILSTGKEKLLRSRSGRESPLIDRTLYTSLNGLFISAYLKAYRAFRDTSLKDFALKSLERIMKIRFINDELLHTEGVKALLDDYMQIVDAFIAAYEITGDTTYGREADVLMETCIAQFWDREGGGFFDAENAIGGVRLKGIEDIPHPSANSLGIMNLVKLHYMTNKDAYSQFAETALKAFASRTKDMGIHAAYYLCAMDAYLHVMKLDMKAAPRSGFADAALSTFNPYTIIVYGEDRGYVTPCRRGSCYEAMYSPDSLRDFLRQPPPRH